MGDLEGSDAQAILFQDHSFLDSTRLKNAKLRIQQLLAVMSHSVSAVKLVRDIQSLNDAIDS